jgi:hypothetical protein
MKIGIAGTGRMGTAIAKRLAGLGHRVVVWNRTPAGAALLTSYYGGMLDRAAMELSNAAVAELLLSEHSRIFRLKLAAPEMLKIIRYPAAIPQLLPDHPERIAAVRQALAATPGVYLAGNYITGVGVEHARYADDRVQLVDGPVGLDAQGIFGNPFPPDEAGLALVAGTGVDTRDADGHRRRRSYAVRRSLERRPCSISRWASWGVRLLDGHRLPPSAFRPRYERVS